MKNLMNNLKERFLNLFSEEVVEEFDNVKAFRDLCTEYRKLDKTNSGDMDIDIQKRKLIMLEIDSVIRAEKKARNMDTQSERSRETATKWKWLREAEEVTGGIKVELDKIHNNGEVMSNTAKRFVNDL